MDGSEVDRVLACRTLPSLPGVALQVIDLTRDAGVRIDAIAKLVQNDPALTAKILRTVNSSYYGLSNPCPTIGRAVSLLGLNTVKSLVLGFSLVEMTAGADKRGFDLTAYWRRTIYSAAAARLLARRTRQCDPEEAFIGALLQDVGMLAAHAALGEAYSRVLAAAPEDHDGLCAVETEALGFDHASVGARLMERWKLPPQILECTRRHHSPESAWPEHAALVKLVALGMDAAAAMTVREPKAKLSRFKTRAKEWLGIPHGELDGVLEAIADGAGQLSALLQTQTGDKPDVAALLAEANEQLTIRQIEVEREATTLERSNKELLKQVATDALTGLANRKQFDAAIAARFDEAIRERTSLAVLFTDADSFKAVNDTLGHQAGDAVLVELARRLREVTGSEGTVCRYGGEEFAVILPGTGLRGADALAERLRRAVEERPVDLSFLQLTAAEQRITISVGVAATEQGGFDTAAKLVHAADEAVYVAKRAGRNCVRRAAGPGEPANARRTPRENSPGRPDVGGAIHLLLVEADPLLAKLIELLFAKRQDVRVRTAGSADDARGVLAQAGPRPDVILCNQNLPGMSGLEFIRALRATPLWSAVPILAILSSAQDAESAAALQAGATACVTKAQLCTDFGKWIGTILSMGAQGRAAA